MAEVRKKEVEDKYNTSSIKTDNVKKAKVNKTVAKKKDSRKKEKKGLIANIMIFFNGVKSEFKKVHWTPKNDMIKYSVASIVFILFCSAFFYLIDVVFALVRSLFS